jgi:hypothetical protein
MFGHIQLSLLFSFCQRLIDIKNIFSHNMNMKLYQKLILAVLTILILVGFSALVFTIVNQNNEIKILKSRLETTKVSSERNVEQTTTKKTTTATPKKTATTTEPDAVISTPKTEVTTTKPSTTTKTTTQAKNKTGNFSSFGDYQTTGSVSVQASDSGSTLDLSQNFQFSGAPDPVLYLCNEAQPSNVKKCVIISALEKDSGSQSYKLNQSEVETYNHVVLWCRAFSLLMGSAQLN